MDDEAIASVLEAQDGVICRRQILAAGGGDHDIARQLRRRVWARVHEGVYVAHTGQPSPLQHLWAATLVHASGVLTAASALAAYGLDLDRDAHRRWIEVAVPPDSRCDDPDGVRSVRLTDFADVALVHLSPPRVTLEHAVLTVASRAPNEDAAVAVIGSACQTRRTTPDRLVAALERRTRLPHRRLLLEILRDAASGAYSALERRYLRRVEQPHGLPTGRRQRRVRLGRTPAYRDVDYLGLRTVVELDGRLGHEGVRDRWADLDRDVDAAVAGDLTVRLGWRQVLDPCRSAGAVGQILTARGWGGAMRACGPACSTLRPASAPDGRRSAPPA